MPKTASRQKGERSAASQTAAERGEAVGAAWKRFHQSRSSKSRNELIEGYMPLVRVICARIASELPSCVEPDDLVGAGTFGLMDAIERYDPTLGARFETYCAVRIRGAVLDELRYLSESPRNRSRRSNGVPPTQHEAERVRPDQRRRVSLSGSTGDGGVRHIDILQAQGVCDPADLLQEKERRGLLSREVRRLPPAERLLVMLYYYDELTMKQVGDVLSVTESRVCQMHAGILSRLQQRLAQIDDSGSARS